MKVKNVVKSLSLPALILCIGLGLVCPVSVQAASNKVMKVAGLSFSNKKAKNSRRGAEMFATLKGTDKLSKKAMKLSGKVYIPKKAFKKAGDEIMISPELSLWKFPPVYDNNNAGIIYGKYDIILKYTKKKKLVLYKETGTKRKRTKAGKYASVKKDGAYYCITIKKVPITGPFLDEKDEEAAINTKDKFILNAGFGVFSTTKKAWKGTVCLDNIKLKSAKKTQTITFDKKDFQGTYANNWASGGDKQASIAKK